MRNFVRSQVWPASSYAADAEIPEARASWLERFHAGDRAVLDEVYRAHVDAVHRSAGGVLGGADLETVVHEVFFRVMTNADLRKAFHGGDLAAWLVVIARHHAIDYVRRRSREQPAGLDVVGAADAPHAAGRVPRGGRVAHPEILRRGAAAEMASGVRGAFHPASDADGGGRRPAHEADDARVPGASHPPAAATFLLEETP